MDEVSLYKKHFEFHSKLDYVSTINLSRIKEISKRINFASISTDRQVFNNKGNVYHREKDNDIERMTTWTKYHFIKNISNFILN